MLQDTGITTRPLETMKVKEVMQKEVPTIYERDNLEAILRYLEDENFLPYVDGNNEFKGIITRREIFKELNYLAHNFSKHYIALPVYMQANKKTDHKTSVSSS